MKVRLINYYLFSVPVSFEISKIHIPYSRHIIVELEIDGRVSVGEGISYKSSLSQIEKYISEIDFDDIDWVDLIKKEPGLAAAIDQTANFYVVNGRDRSQPNNIAYTKQVFIKSVDKMVDEVAKLVDSGCRDIKLKLGRHVEDDIRLIKILSKKFPNINFKADVNCGYSKQEFIEVLKANEFFIKTWEEPVQKSDQKSLVDIKHQYKIKIMLDESVKSIAELNFYIKENIIDILNIKLSRIGGLSKAKEYVNICKSNKVEISVGCSEELGVGMKAIDELASGINNVFGVEGTGPERLGFDILDDSGFFSRGHLHEATKKFGFKVFEKTKKHSFNDLLSEAIVNWRAKVQNAFVKLKTL